MSLSEEDRREAERLANDLENFEEYYTVHVHRTFEFLRRLAAQPAQHPDDDAVDRFAAAMKAKLAKKRAEGYGGWNNPDECSVEFLSERLHKHADKGDPVDVANFCMMLHERGSSIVPKPAQVPMTSDEIKCFLATNCIYLGKSFSAMLTEREAVEVVKFIEAHHGIGGKP